MISLQNLSWVNEMKKEGRAEWHVLLLYIVIVNLCRKMKFFMVIFFS